MALKVDRVLQVALALAAGVPVDMPSRIHDPASSDHLAVDTLHQEEGEWHGSMCEVEDFHTARVATLCTLIVLGWKDHLGLVRREAVDIFREHMHHDRRLVEGRPSGRHPWDAYLVDRWALVLMS